MHAGYSVHIYTLLCIHIYIHYRYVGYILCIFCSLYNQVTSGYRDCLSECQRVHSVYCVYTIIYAVYAEYTVHILSIYSQKCI